MLGLFINSFTVQVLMWCSDPVTSVILILLTFTAFCFVSSTSRENVAVLKYFERTVTSLRCIYKAIKSTLNLGNA